VIRPTSVLKIILFTTALVLNSIFIGNLFNSAWAQPSINDSNLNAEVLVKGLSSPTSIAFLDNNNILVLEKEGTVRLVSKGILQESPVLQLPVDSKNERGLLGIAVMNNDLTTSTAEGKSAAVFLYFTEEGKESSNKVYKYRWDGNTLVDPTLILDLPSGPGTNHQGGKLVIGPDHYLYVVIGEMQREGKLQNMKNGPDPDDSGVIFRVDPQNGSPAKNNPFQGDVVNRYYAYGIRNSFGIAFDSLTGALWDTENGEKSYDEINIVKPGFNSGWKLVMGPLSKNGISQNDLVNLPGSKYADPVFSWVDSFGITDLEFFNSSKLGQKYTNNIFVGDISNGNLYFFEVNQSRNGLKFDDGNSSTGLSDLVADNKQEISAVTLGTGFGGITDIETGPDGFLYILSYDDGAIYRISSNTSQ
jgi:aldose sugar dehydrogenase